MHSDEFVSLAGLIPNPTNKTEDYFIREINNILGWLSVFRTNRIPTEAFIPDAF